MSSWYSSWLPGLPSIDFALPSSIQRRFISFALKKSLGHFLRPGQLDVHQIDAQIGSGHVQVKDVVLDNEAINSMLTGLPIKLHDGSIGVVTARIPWPNPLTSTLGFSIQSFHLTFHLVPVISEPVAISATNLADSVASVAETFIHDELTPREEASLRESFHPDLARDHGRNVPGSMDPFLHAVDDEEIHLDVDPAGVSMFATLIERLLARFEFDAVDVKITITHPEHASFTFSIAEVCYGTEDISSQSPATQARGAEEIEQTSGESRKVSISGLKVTARDLRPPTLPSPISLPTSMVSSVSPNAASRIPRSSHRSPLASPSSSSSSLDEDTQLLMSQSLAYLPPRPASIPSSPSSTMTSSMYQSAISTTADTGYAMDLSSRRGRTPPPPGNRSWPANISTYPVTTSADTPRETNLHLEDEIILSFGAESIILRLTTPPVSAPTHELGEDPSRPQFAHPAPSNRPPQKPARRRNMQLTFSAGVLACAFRAWHIRGALDMLCAWSSHHIPVSTTPAKPSSASNHANSIFALCLNASMKMRGAVIILLPSGATGEHADVKHDTPLSRFFARPLVPPRLVHGCMRIFLDNLSTSISLLNPTVCAAPPTQTRAPGTPAPSTAQVVTIGLVLNDISAFVLLADPKDTSRDMEPLASPILITDHNLPRQYSTTHVHPDSRTKFTEKNDYPQLPQFSILDWTHDAHQTHSTKLSTWRTKPKPKATKRRDSRTEVGGVPSSPCTRDSIAGLGGTQTVESTLAPALSVKGRFILVSSENGQVGGLEPEDPIEVDVIPLHIFADLGLALGSNLTLSFLDEVFGSQSGAECNRDNDEDSDRGGAVAANMHSVTPGVRNRKERETERERLERLVLEDLDLDLDYRDSVAAKEVARKSLASRGQRSAKSRRSGSQQRLKIIIYLSMIRLQVRCPPPPSKAPRSGAVILDLRGIRLSDGTGSERKPGIKFADSPSAPSASHTRKLSDHDALLTAQCQRVVVAASLAGDATARVILSLGSLSSLDEAVPESSRFGTDISSPVTKPITDALPLRIFLSQTKTAAEQSCSRAPTSNTLIVIVDVPSVHADISKPLLDGLQLWVDDVSQLVERTLGGVAEETDTERAESRTPSLIGSRFFAKSRRHGSRCSDETSNEFTGAHVDSPSETMVKIVLSEAFVRLNVLRENEYLSPERPFDILASDVNLLIELTPRGMDETVITLSIMDLNINDTSPLGFWTSLVSLTMQRGLTTTPKSMVQLHFTSLLVPETTAQESRVKLTIWGFTYNASTDLKWVADLGRFIKAPPGAFEAVIPSERTQVVIKIVDSSIRGLAPTHPGALVLYIGELDFATDIVGDSPEFSFHLLVLSISVLFVDSLYGIGTKQTQASPVAGGSTYWKGEGYALFAEIRDLDLRLQTSNVTSPSDTQVAVNRVGLRIHLCADTLHAFTAFIGDVTSVFKPPTDMSVPKPKKRPTTISEEAQTKRGIMSSVDEHAFRQVPEVGPAPDMINDDLPSNLDYLDASFGTAAGLRELRDDDLDEFDLKEAESGRVTPTQVSQQLGITSNVGGETIKLLAPLNIIEHHFDTLPPDSAGGKSELWETIVRLRVHNCDVVLFLYDGYDWVRTRKTIEEGIKEMRRRLTKIRQLIANGQIQDPSVEETSTLLFNSVYIGLEQNVDELEPGALIAAIDEELNDDVENESQGSWQSLHPPSAVKGRMRSPRVHGKRLTRSRGPSIEFRLSGLYTELDQYCPGEPFVSRTFATVRDLEILDHIKTSTWQKFLTELRSDSRGNVRETDSNMVRVELRTVHPVPNHPSEEARLRAKILPLRLYIDQDALDFLKKFFGFQDVDNPAANSESSDSEIYFQHAEVFPIDVKLDYKPRRVDYRALREGKTIELMNFFHFDGSEMTLRHITLAGITGWPRFFDMLNDLWTPDVKATQLVDFISGVSPIRSVVNVGSGVADLVLLPITQYKKDGRIVRGVQKGTTAFVKSTAMEAIKLGARLATGTQVILEQAEHVLGGQFKDSITMETLQVSPIGEDFMGRESGSDEDGAPDLISKYAEQPMDVKEGVQSAYKSLQRNLNSAAQTILAVPMEVYERSGNEGPVRAVIRAVPIAVLKPMIGASEAVSKTLMGLQNSMDPNIRYENEDKYKRR